MTVLWFNFNSEIGDCRDMSASILLFASPTPSVGLKPKLRQHRKKKRVWVCCNGGGDTVVYQGMYGPWRVEPSDVTEVLLYRSGLVTAASSFVVGASSAFLPLPLDLDLLYALGGSGVGLSLLLIHIYVTPIKRTLQALWLLGALGSSLVYSYAHSLGVADGQQGQGLVLFLLHNPTAVWLVGPLFASLTGLVFKEGLCYGKLEAGLLTFIIPCLLLGHLSGLMDDGVKLALLGSWMLLFGIFAARKFTQPIKDDIGDKSIFMFNSLSEDDKKALLEKIEQQKLDQNQNVG